MTEHTTLIIDTNVVLDLWLFEEPGVRALQHRWGSTHHAVGSAPMRQELAHVLARMQALPVNATRWFGRKSVDDVLGAWDQTVRLVPAPTSRPLTWPRCSDPDDQMFIDLALAHGANALLTRDRALLKLARRMQTLGVWVCTPEQWQHGL